VAHAVVLDVDVIGADPIVVEQDRVQLTVDTGDFSAGGPQPVKPSGLCDIVSGPHSLQTSWVRMVASHWSWASRMGAAQM
jgi:hypothetical protein